MQEEYELCQPVKKRKRRQHMPTADRKPYVSNEEEYILWKERTGRIVGRSKEEQEEEENEV